MKEMIENIVKCIVDKPEDVSVNISESENTKIYEISVGDGDIGQVIGKRGKNVCAIKTLVSAVSAKEGGKRSILELIE